MKTENAIITSADIYADPLLSISFGFEGDGWGIGFPIYKWGIYLEAGLREIFSIFDVTRLSDMEGKPCRVRIDDQRTFYSFGHFMKDQWFSPKEFFSERIDDED